MQTPRFDPSPGQWKEILTVAGLRPDPGYDCRYKGSFWGLISGGPSMPVPLPESLKKYKDVNKQPMKIPTINPA